MVLKQLKETIEQVLGMFDEVKAKRSLSLTVNLADDIGNDISTDKASFTKILIQLIDNALRYSSGGSVKVEVTNDSEEKECLKISVIDTGVGIKQEVKKVLYSILEGKREDLMSDLVSLESAMSLQDSGLVMANKLATILHGKGVQRALEISENEQGGTCVSFKVMKSLIVD